MDTQNVLIKWPLIIQMYQNSPLGNTKEVSGRTFPQGRALQRLGRLN